MTASLIEGKQIGGLIRDELRQQVNELKERGITPGLAVILVGENPASQSYVKMKEKACAEMGFYSVTKRLGSETGQQEVLDLIESFNRDEAVHGILVQLPLPGHIDEEGVLLAISPHKDVDGFHPLNIGRLVAGKPAFVPATPAGIQQLLLRSGHDPEGRHVVIVGRSNIVGKPMANLLMQKGRGGNATVTVCHTRTPDIGRFTRQADILIVAAGRPEYITGEMIKPGAVVIDVGVNRVDDPAVPRGYRLVGDVHVASAAEVASAITPVPGGVGPMTITMLLYNTVQAARAVLRQRQEGWIGTDEAGKGDYFGPLVVAAVHVTEETARRLEQTGIRDSKKISDRKAHELAGSIKGLCPYAIVAIGPEKYNELYNRIQNLNRLLAWGHARAIENILATVPCGQAISDQFGDEQYLLQALLQKGKSIRLEQRTRAEEDTAVAAASILARAEFLKRLEALSDKWGVHLPKGATHVLEAGREFIARHGRQALSQVAKVHFKTTEAIS